MAKDLAIKQICPHQVIGEWLSVDRNDRRTVRPVMPPSGQYVELRVNGQEVPPEGVYSQIEITGNKLPPFEITQGLNDTFKIKGYAPITLPPGKYLDIRELSQTIQRGCPRIKVSTSSRGTIQLSTAEREGRPSTLFLEGGTSHETLGIPLYRQYQSKVIVPPWSLVKPPGHPDERERYVRFKEPLKALDDVIELSYFTRRENCRRCQGLVTEHDFRYDHRGDPIFVSGLPLLVQEVEKIVLTVRGTNVFYTWYGTSISDLIGSKIIRGGRFIETQLVGEISSTLAKYKDVKNQQATHQPVRDSEFLQRVQNISVEQDEFDPTTFRVEIAIQNRASEIDVISKTISLGDS